MTPLLLLLAGATCGAACTWASRAAALRFGIVNAPNPLIPQHTRPVAYLGGVGIAAGAAVAMAGAALLAPDALPGVRGPLAGAVALGAALFLALGLADDLRPLTPPAKLLLQLAAALAAAAAGVAWHPTGLALVDVAVSALWMVVVVNAVNLTDVSDALAAGAAAAAFVVLGVAGPAAGGELLVVAGAALGFLAFNRPPATIFLGDAGSHLLGFVLAAATLCGAAGAPAWPALPWAAMTAGAFLFEMAFITVQRVRRDLPWWRGSPDHSALRLQARGMGRAAVAALGAAASALLAGGAASLWRLSPPAGAGVVAVSAAVLAAGWQALARCAPPTR